MNQVPDVSGLTNYSPLQVKDMYWKACLVVLIVAVFNLTTIGNFVWESIPSLRSLMEVLIAGDKAFRSNRLDPFVLVFRKFVIKVTFIEI